MWWFSPLSLVVLRCLCYAKSCAWVVYRYSGKDSAFLDFLAFLFGLRKPDIRRRMNQ